MRETKDGWPIYKAWYEYDDNGKKKLWVETDCYGCLSYHVARVTMPMTKLTARGPDRCDGCLAYREHTNPY